jgi:hypothetical protein
VELNSSPENKSGLTGDAPAGLILRIPAAGVAVFLFAGQRD